MMGETAKARIAYVGDALANGEMDVKDLAPALIAFADLVESAHHALGGEENIHVLLNQDSLKKGSFDITMILDMGVLDQVKLFAGMMHESGLSDLMDVLGWGQGLVELGGMAGGIFALIKKVKGRHLTQINHKGHKAEIELDDGTIIETDSKTLTVFLDAKCRINIEKVVQPVNVKGIDRFEIRNPKEPEIKEAIESIDKREVGYFKAPPQASFKDEQLTTPKDMELTVKITSVNFQKGHKWQLTDGTSTFWASIQDEKFVKDVDEGQISFTSGDMMKIRYHVEQSIKNGNLTSEYIVTEVLDIIKKPTQIRLDFNYDGKQD